MLWINKYCRKLNISYSHHTQTGMYRQVTINMIFIICLILKPLLTCVTLWLYILCHLMRLHQLCRLLHTLSHTLHVLQYGYYAMPCYVLAQTMPTALCLFRYFTIHYIITNNGKLKLNYSVFPRSEGYITQNTLR